MYVIKTVDNKNKRKAVSSFFHLNASQKIALGNVKDPLLRNALKSYLKRCHEEKQ